MNNQEQWPMISIQDLYSTLQTTVVTHMFFEKIEDKKTFTVEVFSTNWAYVTSVARLLWSSLTPLPLPCWHWLRPTGFQWLFYHESISIKLVREPDKHKHNFRNCWKWMTCLFFENQQCKPFDHIWPRRGVQLFHQLELSRPNPACSKWALWSAFITKPWCLCSCLSSHSVAISRII